MKEMLNRLVYRSRGMLRGTTQDRLNQVQAILRSSRTNNPPAGLTGVLLFDGTKFLQVVEGPSHEVERLCELIASDNRHEELDILDLTTVTKRNTVHFTIRMVAATSNHVVGFGVRGRSG